MKKTVTFLVVIVLLSAGTSVSQRLYFGRNKIQYTEFDWMVLSTDHFNIYYYPEMKELAERGAYYAEESYKILENKFNHSITEKIPLIFYSSHLYFQQTNTTPFFLPEGVGGFFEYLKGRVVIPSDGSTFRFRRVIHHELVHVFSHSKLYWVQKNQGKLLHVQAPLWFTEGLAELWSGEWDSQSEMVIADQVLEGTLVPITSFSAIAGSYLMYKEGEKFLRYIVEQYGEEKILMFFEYINRGDKFEDVFRLITGKGYAELNEEWMYSLKKEYYPRLDSGEIPSMVTTRITDTGFNEAPAFYRNDGKDYIYYISNTTGYTNIVYVPLQGENRKPRVLIEGERTGRYEAIHFLSSKIDINDDGLLAFSTKSGETDILYIYDLHKKTLVDEFKFPEIVTISSPSWSNDKQNIAFAGLNKGGHRDIYVLSYQEGELIRVTDDFYEDNNPAWSPDDGSLVFSSARNSHGRQGAYNLFIKELSSGSVYQITDGLQIDASPAWSHDGKYLAYTSDLNGTSNIYMMRMNEIEFSSGTDISLTYAITSRGTGNGIKTQDIGSRLSAILYEPGSTKQITRFTTGAFDPEFTPEGDIVFTAFERYSYQIHYLEDTKTLFDERPELNSGGIKLQTETWEANRIPIVTGENARIYKNQYSLDIAQTQVSTDPLFGSGGGAQFAVTDLLGNDQYYLMLYNNSQTRENFFRSFNFSFMKLSLKKRTNHNYGLFHFSGRRFNRADSFFYERFYGGFFGFSYPVSVFQRFEFSMNFGKSEREEEIGGKIRNAVLLGGSISYVKDNSIWGPTGPLDGERFIISLGRTKDIRFNNVNYTTFIVDLRKYFRLTNRTALAVRAMTYRNKGKEAQRFYIGGSWDLRGYPLWQSWGQQINFFSMEYRFPFIDTIGVRFPFGGMGFRSIRGALFFDAARINDFEKDFTPLSGVKFPQKLGSAGVGFRMNLAGALVLRLDIGKRINSDFSGFRGNTFKQFFFGWDF